MKFKLIQITTLLIFVMSVVYMGQVPNVFGHSKDQHQPQFYVRSSNGDPLSNRNDDPCAVDPRSQRHYYDSNGNGTESASSWDLYYYSSPLLSGDHDSDEEINFVFGARIDFSASAGNRSCSGSVTPNITMDMGLTTDYRWGGEATITLKIPSKTVHSPSLNPNICTSRRIEGPVVKPLKGEVRIRVSDTIITNKQSGDIKVSLESGSGSVSASYTKGTEVQRTEVHAYPFGFSMTLSVGWWHAKWYEAIQMGKSAEVSGFLTFELIDPDDIDVEFEGRPCPLNDHDSGT